MRQFFLGIPTDTDRHCGSKGFGMNYMPLKSKNLGQLLSFVIQSKIGRGGDINIF